MRQFGLIGYPLSHSFSKKYFTDKFVTENIQDCRYDIFPIEQIEKLPALINDYPSLQGLNVTIPYKEKVIPYLDSYTEVVQLINEEEAMAWQQETTRPIDVRWFSGGHFFILDHTAEIMRLIGQKLGAVSV